ncbi:hypothetical protein KUTeg_012747 [Tegillarca granosa]|uniref:SET domain-containing protein n=1 Tax=Tegillarca granosa TaxID=220873 RepID=A0ABQ9F0G7_TEGGR|nr:hypothetical protein KUTeg_012747 [Tegillarca granosa]
MKIKVVQNIQRLCLFAVKDIYCGEELLYDYGDNSKHLWWVRKEATEGLEIGLLVDIDNTCTFTLTIYGEILMLYKCCKIDLDDGNDDDDPFDIRKISGYYLDKALSEWNDLKPVICIGLDSNIVALIFKLGVVAGYFWAGKIKDGKVRFLHSDNLRPLPMADVYYKLNVLRGPLPVSPFETSRQLFVQINKVHFPRVNMFYLSIGIELYTSIPIKYLPCLSEVTVEVVPVEERFRLVWAWASMCSSILECTAPSVMALAATTLLKVFLITPPLDSRNDVADGIVEKTFVGSLLETNVLELAFCYCEV